MRRGAWRRPSLLAVLLLAGCGGVDIVEADRAGEIRRDMSWGDLTDLIGEPDEDRDTVQHAESGAAEDVIWHYGAKDPDEPRCTFVFRDDRLRSWTRPR